MRPRARITVGIVVLVACLGVTSCARPGTGPTSQRGPVSLEAPFGDRAVVDLTSGAELAARPRP